MSSGMRDKMDETYTSKVTAVKQIVGGFFNV